MDVMINTDKIVPVIEAYKRDFSKIWTAGENHKWKAVKHFQDNWDIDAEDFAEMFKKATDKFEEKPVIKKRYGKNITVKLGETVKVISMNDSKANDLPYALIMHKIRDNIKIFPK